jgi:hypothetical protein
LHADQNDEVLPAATSPNDAFHPPSIAHAERAAHLMNERYRRRTAAECRHALARMYGHAGWDALCAALAGGAAASAFDEEADDETVAGRRERQRDVALVWLAGVDESAAREARELDAALLTHASHSISQRYDPLYNGKRLERARYAYNLAYAAQVIDEVRPTAREGLDIPRDDDGVELPLRVDLLPRALKSWLCHHRPLLERWAGMIGGMRVRQRCPAELLDFSFAWGELCLQHGVNIPKALQIYPVSLCAQWYAWLACVQSPQLQHDLARLDDERADEGVRFRARAKVRAAIQEEEARFLLMQPREDFRFLSPSARQQQMHAGHAAVKRYMSEAATEHTIKTILAKPSWLSLPPLLALR